MVSSWPFPSQHPVDALQAWAEAGYPADVVMVNEARGILGVLGWPRMRARTVAKLLQDIHGRGNVCSCGQVQSPQGFNVLCGACIETAGARTNGS